MENKTSITMGRTCNKCGIFLAGLIVFFGLIFLLLKILRKKPEVIVYGAIPIFCKEETSGRVIRDLLYYEMRERLKNG